VKLIDEKIPSHELFYMQISTREFIYEKEYPVFIRMHRYTPKFIALFYSKNETRRRFLLAFLFYENKFFHKKRR
jgi:hypothetical protein